MANWQILGVGAIGGLWACYLHKSGHHVELLLKDRQLHTRYLAAGGLTLVRQDTRELLRLDASVNSEPGASAEYLLIATKAHQTLAAMHMAGARLEQGHARVLLLQNGMGVAEPLVEQFPSIELYCGVTTEGAYNPVPFTVVHAGTGRTDIGAFRQVGDSRVIVERLPTAWLEVVPSTDIEGHQWQKLAMNCAINGLTVIYHCRNGELLERSGARARIARLCVEIEQVGSALGYGAWVADLYQKSESVLRATAANYNSMYQDIDRHRRTEIDYLNGYLLLQAQRLGIRCPENQSIYEEVKRREAAFQ